MTKRKMRAAGVLRAMAASCGVWVFGMAALPLGLKFERLLFVKSVMSWQSLGDLLVTCRYELLSCYGISSEQQGYLD